MEPDTIKNAAMPAWVPSDRAINVALRVMELRECSDCSLRASAVGVLKQALRLANVEVKA